MIEKKKHRIGCLMPLGIYVLVFVIFYFVTLPKPITDDFLNSAGRQFSVAVGLEIDGATEWRRMRLQTLHERDPELPRPLFMLAEPELQMDYENFYIVTVLEDHGDWQLLEFDYSNTYNSTSVYRAYADRIEPVSYQPTFGVGHMMFAPVLILPTILLAWVITMLRNRRSQSS